MQQRASMVNSIKNNTPRAEKKNKWREAQILQHRINSIVHTQKKKVQQDMWIRMAENDKEKGSGQMWKQLSRARRADTTQFPNQIRKEDDTMATGKKDVLISIEDFFKGISDNKDGAAQDFHNPNKPWAETLEQKTSDPDTELRIKKGLDKNKQQDAQSECNREPTYKEIQTSTMKSNKDSAPGYDEIQTQAITVALDILMAHLHPLFCAMWRLSWTPPTWQEAITKLLHKKGPTTIIGNYRPITLLSTKIWERILNTRMTTILEKGKTVSPMQSGSRGKFSAAWTIMVRKF